VNATDLHLASGLVDERDGALWATLLPVGEWKLRPGLDGKPRRKPLRVVEGHAVDRDIEVGLQDLVDAYRDGAIQHVTIPLSHADRVDENTGFIDDVAIEDDPKLGCKALRVKLRFTEPLIAEKVKRGTIAGRSAGILFDYTDKETERSWPMVLGHMALTNKPWIKGMPPLGEGMLSEDAIYFQADGEANPGEEGETTEEPGDDPELAAKLNTLTDTLDDWSNGDLEVVAFDGDSAIVRDEDGDLWRVPVGDDGTPETTDSWDLIDAENSEEGAAQLDHLASMTPGQGDAGEMEHQMGGMSESRTDHAKPRRGGDHMGKYDNLTPDQLIAELQSRDVELSESRRQKQVAAIDARIEAYSDAGYDQFPGLLRVARDLMLADDGDVAALMLAEDGSKQSVTVTEIIERLLDAIPVDQSVGLAEQHDGRFAGKRPDNDTATENMTARERADAYREQLQYDTHLIKTS
jgi:phage I-like protein